MYNITVNKKQNILKPNKTEEKKMTKVEMYKEIENQLLETMAKESNGDWADVFLFRVEEFEERFAALLAERGI